MITEFLRGPRGSSANGGRIRREALLLHQVKPVPISAEVLQLATGQVKDFGGDWNGARSFPFSKNMYAFRRQEVYRFFLFPFWVRIRSTHWMRPTSSRIRILR